MQHLKMIQQKIYNMTEDLKNTVEYPDTNLPIQQRASETFGMFQTVSVAPTKTPTNWFNQVQIYVNGATLRLYWYDTVANVWHYVTATA